MHFQFGRNKTALFFLLHNIYRYKKSKIVKKYFISDHTIKFKKIKTLINDKITVPYVNK